MIQIATMGLTPVVIEEGLQKIRPDKLYIIHTENVKGEKPKKQVEDQAKKLKKNIEKNYKIDVTLTKVDKFDTSGVIYSILDIIRKERNLNKELSGDDFVINITGGTKAMVAGASCAAYLAQTKMYYVPDPEYSKGKEPVIELPVPRRAVDDSKGETAKTTSIILQKILEFSPTNNKHLLEKLENEKIKVQKTSGDGKKPKKSYKKINGQFLSYHLNKLEEAGLITKTRGWMKGKKKDTKLNTIEITETGKYFAYFPEIIGTKF